jgi:hypothetical protein
MGTIGGGSPVTADDVISQKDRGAVRAERTGMGLRRPKRVNARRSRVRKEREAVPRSAR